MKLQVASLFLRYAEVVMGKRKFRIIGPLVASLHFGAIGALAAVPLISAVGCSQGGTVTGDKPATDADMKTVVINVFGMT